MFEYLLVVAYAFIGIGFIFDKNNIGLIKIGALPLFAPFLINAATDYKVIWISVSGVFLILGGMIIFSILGACLNSILYESRRHF